MHNEHYLYSTNIKIIIMYIIIVNLNMYVLYDN